MMNGSNISSSGAKRLQRKKVYQKVTDTLEGQ